MAVAEATILVRVPLAPARGTPAITQSTYGLVGNLELVVPDAEDGLWVHWRNNDDEDVVPGVVSGGWSAGLHFASGARYDAVAVLQTRQGPDFVEVLARSGTRVDRTFWSPGNGFSRPEPAFAADGMLELLEEDDALVAVTGTGRTLAAAVSSYPRLDWRETEPRPPVLASTPVPPCDAFATCRSTLDGGRTELVLRIGTWLFDAGSGGDPTPIETHAWVAAQDASSVNVRPPA